MGSQHKYFVIAKHDFYLEDAKKAFAGVGIGIRVSNQLELLQREILDSAGNCTVFVPHYSKIINLDDFPNVKFIGFHTGDLPKDRGGSPIQNKILQKEYSTHVSAIVLESEIDSGAIYTQRDIDLSEGNIEFMLKKISLLIASMMIEIVLNNLEPRTQTGNFSLNKRIRVSSSELPGFADLSDLYDRIRMVDGLDYPKAFIRQGNYKISFSEVVKEGNQFSARALFESGE